MIFLVGEEGWRLANPKPKLVSSLERGELLPSQTSFQFGGELLPSQTSLKFGVGVTPPPPPPNLKLVWGLGRGG